MLVILLLFTLLSTAFTLTSNTDNVITPRDFRRPSPPRPQPSIYRPTPGTPGYGNVTAPRSCGYRSYTALGDSYSAGLNYANNLLLPNCDGSSGLCNGGDVCLRNADAFPVLMQNAHNFSSFQFNACSGANTTDCDLNQVKVSSYDRPDLVTITIGGDNNQAFLGLIVNCVYQRDDTYCQYAIQNAQYTVSTLESYLKPLFRDILTTNPVPYRRVVVPGYPRLWSTTNSTTCQHPVLANVPLADRKTMNDLADAINAVLKQAVKDIGFGFTFADADPLFEGNRLCDNVASPYFQYDFTTALYGVFHPTEIGQQMMFKAVEASAGCA